MKKGLTLLELLLVVGIMAIFSAAAFPFLTRNISWFYEIARSETAISQLYDTGLVVSRALTQDSRHLASFTVSANNLYYDNKLLLSNVSASFDTVENSDTIVFKIATTQEPIESLRFVILPLR